MASIKTIAGWRKTRLQGLTRVEWLFTLALAAYNLICLPKLLAPSAVAMRASLDIEYAATVIVITWAGFEEMDEVTGSGSAELRDDGTLEIEFAHHLGDEATVETVRL